MPFEDRKYPHYGRYLRIDRPRLLEFTWISEGTRGKESVVTIELVARGGKTELTLTHVKACRIRRWLKATRTDGPSSSHR